MTDNKNRWRMEGLDRKEKGECGEKKLCISGVRQTVMDGEDSDGGITETGEGRRELEEIN